MCWWWEWWGYPWYYRENVSLLQLPFLFLVVFIIIIIILSSPFYRALFSLLFFLTSPSLSSFCLLYILMHNSWTKDTRSKTIAVFSKVPYIPGMAGYGTKKEQKDGNILFVSPTVSFPILSFFLVTYAKEYKFKLYTMVMIIIIMMTMIQSSFFSVSLTQK